MKQILILLLLISPALASVEGDDDGPPVNPYATSPYHEWMSRQLVNPEAQSGPPHVPFNSCCDHTDRVKTQFRVNRDTNGDEWWWLDPSDATWKLIPRSIIHEEADPTMPLQLRTEGVLFVYFGIPTCFFPPDGGI